MQMLAYAGLMQGHGFCVAMYTERNAHVQKVLDADACMCRCDERADIFSYGVVLWELITQEQARRGHLREFQVWIIAGFAVFSKAMLALSVL